MIWGQGSGGNKKIPDWRQGEASQKSKVKRQIPEKWEERVGILWKLN